MTEHNQQILSQAKRVWDKIHLGMKLENYDWKILEKSSKIIPNKNKIIPVKRYRWSKQSLKEI